MKARGANDEKSLRLRIPFSLPVCCSITTKVEDATKPIHQNLRVLTPRPTHKLLRASYLSIDVSGPLTTLDPEEGFATMAEAWARYGEQLKHRASEGFVHAFSVEIPEGGLKHRLLDPN